MQIYTICFTHNRLQAPQSQEWMQLPDMLIDWIDLRKGERVILEPKRCDHCKEDSDKQQKVTAKAPLIVQYITGPAH
jgi:hypothetical protein